ncbi:MAG TPA: D-amino acid aminotransferase [Gammaproteobacteria bacterium]
MAEALPTVYLNGKFIPRDEARISPFDRGFLYGDGVYEMIASYGGSLFRLDDHLARLERSLAEVRMTNPRERAAWRELLATLVRENGGGNMNVYVQVTRGAKPERDHRFPAEAEPTVFAMCQPASAVANAALENGIAAITHEDTRWARCDIKATSLMANVLLRQAAEDEGSQETLLLRNNEALEFSASTLFVVTDGKVRTTPNGNAILPGVTGIVVRELVRAEGFVLEEAAIPAPQLHTADEIWLASTTREVLPVTTLDGNPVGSGKPGPAWRRIYKAFQDMKQELAA